MTAPTHAPGTPVRRRARVAVFKFASCDGCQLSILDCEEELLAVAAAVDLAYFPEAVRKPLEGIYDVGLVEGSVTTPHDEERARDLRDRCGVVISIGACATAGGIQALRNYADVREFTRAVYAQPQYISTLERSKPISELIHVDFELRGCPVDKGQLLEVIGAFVAGRRPQIEDGSVCVECKRAGNICVMVAHGTPCLGPMTHAGCGALCPSYRRGCFGCFGPQERVNGVALARRLQQLGVERADLHRLLATFNAAAPGFQQTRDSIGHPNDQG